MSKYIEQAIKIAVESGWGEGLAYDDTLEAIKSLMPNSGEAVLRCVVTSDKDFWQALGRGLGWWTTIEGGGDPETYWKKQQHRFIDHIQDGKDIESYFKEALSI